MRPLSAAALALALLSPLVSPAASPANNSLANLAPAHPRLFVHDSDLPAIHQAIQSDPYAKAEYAALLATCEKLLTTPPETYQIVGPEHTLLATAREMEGRIIDLAGVYRLTRDRRFADRATQEMLAAAAFPDWYPTHFLDTAELTAALGIGYDWLFPILSPADRLTLRTAIVTHGIDPWFARIDAGKGHYTNNWSQVTNGGETTGALAIAEDEPVRANRVLDHARTAIAEIMQLFAPDGGFEEGPVYWNYATAYNVLYLSALESALGTDFGASDLPGFATTPEYRIQANGPLNLYANFGDAHPEAFPAPQMFWFAHRFHRPLYAQAERQLATTLHMDDFTRRESSRFAFLGLAWSALVPPEPAPPLPLAQGFARVDQAYLRSAWNDPHAWFVAFKGGDSKASHGHLDLGSFVLDALGQRWAIDLGPDSYGLPGYFGKQRWSFYRMRTEAHNTLVVDSQNEDLDAHAPLAPPVTHGATTFAIADLSLAYKGKLSAWKRGVELLDGQRVLVQDELTPTSPAALTWNFHTPAVVSIAPDGRTATLTLAGATLTAHLLAPATGRFSTASTEAPAPQAPNPGITNLVLDLPGQTAPQTIAVLFTQPTDHTQPKLSPLATWH